MYLHNAHNRLREIANGKVTHHDIKHVFYIREGKKWFAIGTDGVLAIKVEISDSWRIDTMLERFAIPVDLQIPYGGTVNGVENGITITYTNYEIYVHQADIDFSPFDKTAALTTTTGLIPKIVVDADVLREGLESLKDVSKVFIRDEQLLIEDEHGSILLLQGMKEVVENEE